MAQLSFPVFLSNYLNYLPLPLSDPLKLLLIILAIYLPFYLDGSEFNSSSRYNSIIHNILRQMGMIFYKILGLKLKFVLPKDTKYDASQYIFASHPHGVMSFHHAMFFLDLEGSKPLNQTIPLNKRRALSARPLFRIPILRDIILSCGAVDASVSVAKRCLEHGYSLTVLPGGEYEQLLAQHDEHCIYIRHRKGFCRLSLQYNVSIIPFYCFGETSTYHTSSLLLELRQWLAKRFFVAIPLPCGWNLFYPLSTTLALHAGKPISPPPVDESLSPHEDQERRLKLIHEEYIRAVTEIFNEHKALYGQGDKQLVIL
jgi:hypothetical protein